MWRENTHAAMKGNSNRKRQNTVMSYGLEDSLSLAERQRQETSDHHDNRTVSFREGSARGRHYWKAAVMPRPG
jgi:hypothetical protein